MWESNELHPCELLKLPVLSFLVNESQYNSLYGMELLWVGKKP